MNPKDCYSLHDMNFVIRPRFNLITPRGKYSATFIMLSRNFWEVL